MSREQLLKRIDLHLNGSEHAAIEDRIIIDDKAGASIGYIRKQLKNIVTDYVIIDYLQLVQVDTETLSRKDEVNLVVGSLKTLAKELDIPIIVLSQLNRSLDSISEDYCPTKNAFRESSLCNLEDVNLSVIHRPAYYKIYEYDSNGDIIKGKVKFVSFKGKDTQTTFLHFNPETMQMSMWLNDERFKEEVANSNAFICPVLGISHTLDDWDESCMSFLESETLDSSDKRFVNLTDMLLVQFREMQSGKTEKIKMLVFIETPLSIGITMKEIMYVYEFMNTNFPIDTEPDIQWVASSRNNKMTKITCAFKDK